MRVKYIDNNPNFLPKAANSTTEEVCNTEQIESASQEVENLKLQKTLNWLRQEISKFVKNNRITDLTLKDLDNKV